MIRLRNLALMVFAVTSIAHGLATVLPIVLNQPRPLSAFGQRGYFLFIPVFLLLGPFILKDGRLHPVPILSFLATTVCFAAVTVAAWQF